MENAYYYFFSAVPQILAGIMALFGVFVLFKLQALSNELSPIVSILYESLSIPYAKEHKEIRGELASLCFDAFNNKSFKPVADYFKSFENDIFNGYPNYSVYLKRFLQAYGVYEKILNRTVFATIFTGITIIICLVLLPFAKYVSCNYILVFSLCSIIIICVIMIFCLLIAILKKSLK
jgi:hypothetical protein